MREMFSGSIKEFSIAGAAVGVIFLSVVGTQAQGPAASGTAPAAATLKTPWGEPDLQGIWTDETDTLLQRSPKYADQEFFSEGQRAELDRERSKVLGSDKRAERGTELDLAGAYNSAFVSWKHVGLRTSLIVDPPNGRIPPLTSEAQKMAAAEREYRLALLQATDACKTKAPIDALDAFSNDLYYESLDLVDAFHPQTILAYEMNDRPLSIPHGAPIRLRAERQLGYKMAKFVMRIEAVAAFDQIGQGKGGYWEDRGYDWYAGI